MRWLVLLALAGWGWSPLKSENPITCTSERTANFSYQLATDTNLTIESVKKVFASDNGDVSCLRVDLSHNSLTFLPADFFNFPSASKIVSLNLSHNNLSSLDSLNFTYLSSLQELDVSHNGLQVLRNGAFSDACCLRVLDMSHNEIAGIQVAAFRRNMDSVKKVNLSFNRLASYEQWQYLFSMSIKLDVSHNRISRFTNELNITVAREQYRNDVNLTYNNLTTLTVEDFAIYDGGKAPSALQIGIYGLSVENNPWVCDCRIHWLVHMARNSLVRQHEKVLRYLSCAQPPELKGRWFGYLLQCPDVLLCNVSKDCPEGCTCQERPQRNYTLVDCDPRRRLYTQLPPLLPSAPLLYLNLSGHQVRQLDARLDYVPRLYGLNVANNHLTEVTSSFLDRASSLAVLDVRQNRLTSLPREARRLPIQHLNVSGNPFQCACDFLWFGDWVVAVVANVSSSNASLSSPLEGGMEVTANSLPCGGDAESSSMADGPSDSWSGALNDRLRRDLSSLTCRAPDGETVALTEMSVERLGCEQLAVGGISAGCVSLLVLCAVVVFWRRQYESKILLFWVHRHCREACCEMRLADVKNPAQAVHLNHTAGKRYHVYVSVDENDDVALNWVRRVLLPLLEDRNMPLRVYLPIRQELAGDCKADSRAKAILQSQNTLVLITAGYSRNSWCRYEFDFACRHLQEENAGQLVLLSLADDDEDNDETVDGEVQDNDRNENGCPDCARGNGQQLQAVGEGDLDGQPGAANLFAGARPDGGEAELNDDDHDVGHGSDDGGGGSLQNSRRELITVPGRPSHARLSGGRAGRCPCLPCWCRRQQQQHHQQQHHQQQQDQQPAEPERRYRAHRLARYCEHGEHMVAVEPLNTYLAERRFWRVSDRLLRQKLLYELSVVKKSTADLV